VEIKNPYADISEFVPEEVIEVLLKTENFRLERIVSDGQATPPGEWYGQDTHEWVLPPEGERGSPVSGNSVDMGNTLRRCLAYTGASAPPGRVAESGIKTIWLALHYPREKKGEIGAKTGAGGG